MKRRITVLLVLGILPWAQLYAQTPATTTFKVSATVSAVCEVTANNLNFGEYNPKASSPHQVTSLLRATCTPETTYNVGLNAGTSPGATVNARKMVSPKGALNYQLYRETSRTSIWGNTTGTDTVTGTGTGLAQDHTVYGAILPGQNVPASTDYSDTITVTIYF